MALKYLIRKNYILEGGIKANEDKKLIIPFENMDIIRTKDEEKKPGATLASKGYVDEAAGKATGKFGDGSLTSTQPRAVKAIEFTNIDTIPDKQNKHDNALITTYKDIVPAINETYRKAGHGGGKIDWTDITKTWKTYKWTDKNIGNWVWVEGTAEYQGKTFACKAYANISWGQDNFNTPAQGGGTWYVIEAGDSDAGIFWDSLSNNFSMSPGNVPGDLPVTITKFMLAEPTSTPGSGGGGDAIFGDGTLTTSQPRAVTKAEFDSFADIETNKTNIATNKTNIATNADDIKTNKANIATNKTNIATNKTNIATNTNDIKTNKANFTQNSNLLTKNDTTSTDDANFGNSYKGNIYLCGGAKDVKLGEKANLVEIGYGAGDTWFFKGEDKISIGDIQAAVDTTQWQEITSTYKTDDFWGKGYVGREARIICKDWTIDIVGYIQWTQGEGRNAWVAVVNVNSQDGVDYWAWDWQHNNDKLRRIPAQATAIDYTIEHFYIKGG